MLRFIAVILMPALIVGLAGCGGGGSSQQTASAPATSSTAAKSSSPASQPSSQEAAQSESQRSGEARAAAMAEAQARAMEREQGGRGGGGEEGRAEAEKEMQAQMEAQAAKRGEEMARTMAAEQERAMAESRSRAAAEEGRRDEQRGPQGPKVEIPKTLIAKSDLAFEKGHDLEAFQFQYAHCLLTPDGLSDYQPQYYEGLESPRLALRWGMAITYASAPDFKSRPPVIGDRPNVLPGKNGRGGPPQGSEQHGGGPGSSKPKDDDAIGNVYYYTANIGRRILEELDQRRRADEPQFGAFISEINFKLPEMQSGRNEHQDPNQNRNPYGNSQPDLSFLNSKPDQLLPGIVYLGHGTSKEILPIARERNIDIVVLFDIRGAKVKKTGLDVNTTRVAVYNANNGRPLYKAAASLTNVLQWRALEKDKDLIEKMIGQMFPRLDETLTAQPMPDWDKNQVFARVKQLVVDQEHKDPLPALTEIAWYAEQDKLTKKAYISAVSRLIGKEYGKIFVENTDPQVRGEAISNFLPPGWKDGLEMFAVDEEPVEEVADAAVSVATPAATPVMKPEQVDPAVKAAKEAKEKAVKLYNTTVKTLLVESCSKCHSATATRLKGKLKLDTREDMLKGGKSGAVLVPGNPEESLLFQAISHTGDVKKMPPRKKLSDEEIASVQEWIKMGAPTE